MKTMLLVLASVFVIQSAHADVPRKAPLEKYRGLWTNSPFTSKPVVVDNGPLANPFDDYTLTGIAPVPGGYRITIINKKNPDVKRVIEPGVKSEFQVVSVNRNPQKTLGTTVVLSAGSMQGTVSFEPDLITLKAAPAPAPQQNNPNLPPGVPQAAAGQPDGNTNGEAVRQPRPRIVPPPARTTNQTSSGNKPSTQGGSRDSTTQPRIERRR